MRVVVPFGPEITDLLSTGTVMVQNNGESGRERREFDDVGHGPIRNVLYAPMTLQRELREFRVDRAIGGKQRASWRASGIVRVTNLLTGVRPDGHADQVPRLATWEDLYLLEFVAELIFVLSRALVEQGKYESELERALHGFRYLIRGATLNSTEVYRAITSGVENDARYRPLMLKDHPGGYYTVGRVQNFQADSMAFLEDMDAQMDKVTRRHVIERRPSVVIEHFHRDVLMVAVKNAERAVEIYDRRKVHFNSLADAGSLDIREVMGDASAFVAVFRNLFENSLKYARRNDAEPHIVLAVDLTKKHAVYVDVRDFGLGVTSTERQFLFTDGFRGSAAYAAGATGSGVGLVYSRQIMTAYGGELTLVKTPDDGRGGAKFRLTFKRRETRK